MSSRTSKRTSSKSDNKIEQNDKTKTQPLGYRLVSFIFIVIFQSAILYYLYNLEDADCNCIRDWRHNFIKAMSILSILLGIVTVSGVHFQICKWLPILLMILSLVNFYAFFTYIGDLNATKCVCAVDKQPNLNSVLNAIRWVPIFIVGVFLILIIVNVIIGGEMIYGNHGK